MKKYTSYKDSGVEWIGEIPEHWELKRIKYLFQEINEKSSDGEEDLLSVSQYTGITNKSLTKLKNEFITRAQSLVGYKKVKKHDLVINIMLAWNGSIGISPYDGIVSPAYCVFRLRESNFPNYFHYLFRSDLYKEEFRKNSTGIIESRLRMYPDSFFRIWSVLPPPSEQKLIANYLDHKVSMIDKSVEVINAEIADLEAYRQSVISETVTKGLNPNTPMKDSGVKWIGEIPEHWKITTLKNILKFNNGRDYKTIQSNNKGYPVYGSGGQFAYATVFIYEGESILFGRKGTINKPLYVNEKFWTVDTMFYTIKKGDNYMKFFYYVSLTIPFDYYVTSTALPSITQTDLKDHKIVHPPYIEQQLIANYLDRKTAKIAAAIKELEFQRDDLKIYKQSLISEAVTGKIDVRDWQPNTHLNHEP